MSHQNGEGFRKFIFGAVSLMVCVGHSVAQTTETRRASSAHPLESEGPRPLRGYEPISRFKPTSKFRVAATAVGEIALELPTEGTVPVCTGLVISPQYVLTARHCLEVRNEKTGTVDYLKPSSITLFLDYLEFGKSSTRVVLKPDPAEKGDGDLDYIVLEGVTDIPLEGRRIPRAGADPGSKDDLYVIHHPVSRPLAISDYHCQATEHPVMGKDFFKHLCATDDGSSGAPIFNADFEIIGIHHEGGLSELAGTYNIGLLLSKIMDHSSIVRKALADYGAVGFATPTVRVQANTAATYFLSSGEAFVKTSDGWSLLLPKSKGGGSVNLQPQHTANGQILLWDPSSDFLYLIPRAGGMVKKRQAEASAWSDLGIGVKK